MELQNIMLLTRVNFNYTRGPCTEGGDTSTLPGLLSSLDFDFF